jgi:hypothetical protein
MSSPPIYSGKYRCSGTCGCGSILVEALSVKETAYLRQLRFEDVNLVEEEDDRGPEEPPRVNNGIKENQRLFHSVLEIDEPQKQMGDGG